MKGRELIAVRLGLKQMGAAEVVARKSGYPKVSEWVKMLVLEAIEGESNQGVGIVQTVPTASPEEWPDD